MPTKTNLTAYSEGTPNGLKVHLALEELGLEYKVLPWPLLFPAERWT